MRPFGGWTGVWLTLHTRGGYVEQFPPVTKAPGEPLPAPALSPGTPRLSAEALLTVAVRLLALLKVEPLAEAPTDLDVCVAVAGLGEGRTVEAEVEQEAEQSHGHSQQTHWRGREVTAPLSIHIDHQNIHPGAMRGPSCADRHPPPVTPAEANPTGLLWWWWECWVSS